MEGGKDHGKALGIHIRDKDLLTLISAIEIEFSFINIWNRLYISN